MIKTIIIALVYFLIGIGIVSCSKYEKKEDPGYIAFVLIFWPLILGVLATICVFICVFGLIILGIDHLRGKCGK